MKERSVILLSGGLDSTINLYLALKETDVVQAVTFNYGQRSADREIEAATYFCKTLNIPHKILDFREIFAHARSTLVDPEGLIPQNELVDIESLEVSTETAKSVWVPNRNGMFLNVAACFAEMLEAQFVIPGFNKEEAVTFLDNSKQYIEAMNKALSFSTQNEVKVHCFTQDMDKVDILETAVNLEIPLDKVWSCYLDEEEPCGRCESCKRMERARQVLIGRGVIADA